MFSSISLPEVSLNDVSNIAKTLSLIVAVIFGMYGFIQTKKKFRVDYTMNLMRFKFEQPDIFRAYNYISSLIIQGKDYDPKDVPDPNMPEMVEKLLSYFELISIGYLNGNADRRVIELQIKSGLRDTYLCCQKYIKERAILLNRKKLYDNLHQVSDIFQRQDQDVFLVSEKKKNPSCGDGQLDDQEMIQK